MRTLAEVKKEIDELTGSDISKMTKVQVSRLKTRLQFLRLIEKYLLDDPTSDFIVKEIGRLENRINKLIYSFDTTQYKDPREAQKKYEKDMNIPHYRTQIRALRFILN